MRHIFIVFSVFLFLFAILFLAPVQAKNPIQQSYLAQGNLAFVVLTLSSPTWTATKNIECQPVLPGTKTWQSNIYFEERGRMMQDFRSRNDYSCKAYGGLKALKMPSLNYGRVRFTRI